MHSRFKLLPILASLLILNSCNLKRQKEDNPIKTSKIEIRKENGRFNLYKDGEQYYIKGAVGWSFLEELVNSGANSLRSSTKMLDEAHRLGLTMLLNIHIAAERDGFDYNNEEAVKEQYLKVKKFVEENKDHPALLMWAIGNELDHIPGGKDYNLKLWNALNDIAGMIKEIDPNHPVMTVVGYGKLEKIKDIKERCYNLDLLGVNAYASIVNVPEWLRKYDWNKPYVVTEWGPSGNWEVPKTKWGVQIEETSTEKAKVYREKYEKVILADSLCIGSYVFLWTTNRQERTHTWYNMFHDSLKTETIETMQYMWTGIWPLNRAPQIESLMINEKKATDNISVNPNSINIAQVITTDPDNDELLIKWELLPEPTKFGGYAGQGETKPEAIADFIITAKEGKLQFKVPAENGRNYRLFVYIHDGKGNIGVANIPFHANGDLTN